MHRPDLTSEEDFNGGYHFDDEGPTETLPGTPERDEVYRRRIAKRVALFHPNDRKLD